MEAPRHCLACTLVEYKNCLAADDNHAPVVPGPDCPFVLLAAKDAEIDWLMGEYREAIRIIKQGKTQFAPDTTNSDADMFLRRAALEGDAS